MARQSASNERSCAPMRQAAGPRAGIENRGITSPSLRDLRDSLIEELTSLHSARRLRAARLSLPCPAGGVPASPRNGGPAAFRFVFDPVPNIFSPAQIQNGLQIRFATRFFFSAESEGFEPPEPCGSTVFKTAAIDHSANFPGTKVAPFFHSAKSLPRFIVRNGGPKIKIRR